VLIYKWEDIEKVVSKVIFYQQTLLFWLTFIIKLKIDPSRKKNLSPEIL
jgi:hypothetical protein